MSDDEPTGIDAPIEEAGRDAEKAILYAAAQRLLRNMLDDLGRGRALVAEAIMSGGEIPVDLISWGLIPCRISLPPDDEKWAEALGWWADRIKPALVGLSYCSAAYAPDPEGGELTLEQMTARPPQYFCLTAEVLRAGFGRVALAQEIRRSEATGLWIAVDEPKRPLVRLRPLAGFWAESAPMLDGIEEGQA